MSERAESLMSPKLLGLVNEPTYSIPVSGSNEPCSQLAPPTEPGTAIVPRVPSGAPMTDGGVQSEGERRYGLMASSACARSSGVKSIRSLTVMPWRSNAGGFVGYGCVGDVRSP